MPFTGKSFEQIVEERQAIAKKLEAYGLDLLEQFLGNEEKEFFESHAYEPIFIARKDHKLLAQADIVIADYNGNSIGRDCEIIMGKEIFDKRLISIVPDPYEQKHPWIRLYSDYIVSSQDEAFALAKQIASFPLSQKVTTDFTREQKDQTDVEIQQLYKENPEAVYGLLPTELKYRWKLLFGEEYNTVLDYSFKPLPKNLRVNTLKISVEDFKERIKKYNWELTPLPFSDVAFRLPEDLQVEFWELPEYKEGLFYIQEFASMLPAIIMQPKSGEKILDIAAAPGSKTTQMAEIMQDTGTILANDNSEERLQILKKAVARHDLNSIEYHLGDGAVLGDLYPEHFDKVMVDAPCSSVGIIRYKEHKFFEWNLLQVYRLTEIQKQLLVSGFNALKPGGTLVYSTCTFAPEENEEIIDYLITNFPNAKVEPIDLPGVKVRPAVKKWGHLEFSPEVEKTIRIYPQDNNTIGFYIAKISKLA